jgi:lipid-A-disaccharide synthase
MALPRRVALVAGETSGDLLAGLLLQGLRQRWPDSAAVGIGGPQMHGRSRASRPGGPARSWRCAATWRCCATTARSSASARSCASSAAAASGPMPSSAWTRPTSTSTGSRPQGAGVKTVHFVCPSIWAWRPERVEKDPPQRRPCAVHLSRSSPSCWPHGIAATYVGHPLANVIPLEPDRAAAASCAGLATRTPVVAILPGSRRSEVQYLAPAFRCGGADAAQPPGSALCGACGAGAARSHRGSPGRAGWDSADRAPGQSHDGAGRLRRDADRQRHRHAGGRAVQAPHGDRLQHELAVVADHARKQLQPWVGLPNILAGEFVVPELLQDAATPQALARRHAGLAAMPPSADHGAAGSASPTCTTLLQRDTANWPPMRSKKFLRLSRPASPGTFPGWSPAWTRPAAGRWPVRWWPRP